VPGALAQTLSEHLSVGDQSSIRSDTSPPAGQCRITSTARLTLAARKLRFGLHRETALSGKQSTHLADKLIGTADKPKPSFVRELVTTAMLTKPHSICILDDDASVRESITQLLDSDQLKARSFEDPEEFLAHAGEHTVPLAVLDVRMPKMSGLEVQARLRKFRPRRK
jgi:PleD family two-component response regulator